MVNDHRELRFFKGRLFARGCAPVYFQKPKCVKDLTGNLKPSSETFEKCSISFKFKEGDNLNHRNTLSISRIKI